MFKILLKKTGFRKSLTLCIEYLYRVTIATYERMALMRYAITTVTLLILLAGCEKDDQSVAKKAGDKVGQVVTEFASGVGHGIDKSMEVTVEISESLALKGIETTVSKSLGMNAANEKGISVYFIANKQLNTSLIARAVNDKGQEVGRSVVDVHFQEDDAAYVKFLFNKEMDTQLVQKYKIDIKKEMGPEQTPTPGDKQPETPGDKQP